MRTNDQNAALDQLSAALFQEVVYNHEVPLKVRAKVGTLLRAFIPTDEVQQANGSTTPIPADFTSRVKIILEKDKETQVKLQDILHKLDMPINQGTLVATGRALAKLGYHRKRMSSKEGRYPIYIRSTEKQLS